ncbi:MAG TPA: cysteine desulfurase family protein [Jiangellaceae bacterium]|nr:cysteine desulfurase family protein [Jiangellaceae bacterium]
MPGVLDGYLDAASTEPLHPAAREVMLAALDDGWADPARLYGAARRARLLLDNAREVVAAAIGARPDEVSFTTSGTQAVHLGVLGTASARRRVGHRVVVSAVEHSSVLQAAAAHAASGGEVTHVPVDHDGRVDAGGYAEALDDATALACLQAANHEVGTLQPVAAVAEACAGRGVPLLVDAAQVVGRLPVPTGWSLLAASAHKWGGPAGIGVLAVRHGVRWRSPLPDDERGSGRVPGFEDVPAALAAAAALLARTEEAASLAASQAALVDRIRARVPDLVPDVEVVGHPEQRLPHLVTFSCLYVDGEALLLELDKEGFAVSSGSSCTASTLRPSHVLEAMGVLTHGNVRVSLARTTTASEVDRFLDVLPGVVQRLRSTAGVDRL